MSGGVRRLLARLASAALVVVAAVLLAGVAAPSAARADDGPAPEEVRRRIELVRSLPPEQRARLHAALESFRALPEAERESLRRKAAKLGPERLEGLAGRDLGALRVRRRTLEAEVDRILVNLGPERIAELTPDEREYVRWLAMRRFQGHVQRRVLGLTSYEELEALPSAERRTRIQAAMKRLVEDRLARLPDEERSRILALPRAERAAEASRLFEDFRMEETHEFARFFDRFRLQEFLRDPPERRTERVARWRERSRWFETARVLREDLGLPPEVRRDLAALGPAEWARVMKEFLDTEDLRPTERRARVERLVRKLYGQRALDPARPDGRVPPLLHAIRERRLSAPE